MNRAFFLIIIFVFLGCATVTVEEGLNRVRSGMDRDSVLDLAGNPRRTFRTDSRDHWIYTFFRNDKEFVRTVTFVNGRVTDVTTTKILRAPSDTESSGETFEELESKLRSDHKKEPGEFKDVE